MCRAVRPSAMDRTAAKTRRFTVTAIGFALIALAPACSKKSAAPRHSTAAPKPVASTIQEPSAVAHGTRKQMNLDVPVYVDGVPMGVLRAGDLPELTPAPA